MSKSVAVYEALKTRVGEASANAACVLLEAKINVSPTPTHEIVSSLAALIEARDVKSLVRWDG